MLKWILLLALLPWPQPQTTPATTAQLTGTVVDRRGGALATVIVTLEAPPPAANRTIITNDEGAYRFSNIAPGIYTARFERTGFLSYTRAELTFRAGQVRVQRVALEAAPTEGADVRSTRRDPTFPLAPGEMSVGVETSLGTFYIAVDTKRAPVTAGNFLKYVDAGLYDWGRFHRATRPDNYEVVPPNRPMMNMIQGGINPARRREGFPAIPLERTSVTGITHVTGVVSMARGAPDTATSDFFVLLDDQPSLDDGGLRFTDGQGGAAFGHVLSGLDVVRKVQQEPVDGQNLSGPVTIRRVWRLKTP